MKARVIKTGEIVDVYHEPQHGQVTNIYKESVLVNGRMWSEDELDFCVKANKAPEKIYRTTTYLDNDKGKTLWKTKPIAGAENIEYIRKDAFIEKACGWLKENKDKYLYNTGEKGEYIPTCSGKMIDDFRKYMEGE